MLLLLILFLISCIYSIELDSIQYKFSSSPSSFRVFSLNANLPDIKGEMDIIEVNNEGKVFCSPKNTNEKKI